MTIADRIWTGVARRVAPLLFKQQELVSTRIDSWQEMEPTYPEVSFEVMAREGWRKNELIFACINKTAKTASQIELKVYQDDEEVPAHPLKALLQRPNPYMSEFDFWYAILTFQALAGRAAFEKERAASGQVVRLWPMRPDYLHPLPSSKEFLGGYRYGKPGEPRHGRFIEAKDVLDLKLFDPIDFYHGWPPVAVAARVGDVDNSQTDFIKLFYEKGGVPPGLLKTKQKLSDDKVTELRARWAARYGGHEHWLQPAVLDADAEYQKVGSTIDELGFETLDSRNEARVCMVMDVPPILVGAKVGLERATYSNYAEARLSWWEDSLVPRYIDLNDGIINQLLIEFELEGSGVMTDWDMSRVAALQDKRQKAWDVAGTALKSGAVTVNEYREMVGLQQVENGDVFLRPITIQDVAEGEEREVLINADGTQPSGNGEEPEEASRLWWIPPPWAETDEAKKFDSREDAEDAIEAALDDYFEGARERIVAEVTDLAPPGDGTEPE
jgi:HK97 family phage portal protein